MPIDPKKFKKIVNNHFDNLSEEEFLKILHKSSPHLFDGNSEVFNFLLASRKEKPISHLLHARHVYSERVGVRSF